MGRGVGRGVVWVVRKAATPAEAAAFLRLIAESIRMEFPQSLRGRQRRASLLVH